MLRWLSHPRPQLLLLRVLTTFSAVLLAFLLANAWYGYNIFQQLLNRDLQLARLSGRILQLDEVLTMSARMAAATGDSNWSERYWEYQPQLDGAIQKAMEISPDNFKESLLKTNYANQQLVAAEKQSLLLVEEARLEEAKELLFNEHYERLKAEYHNGLRELRERLDLSSDRNVRLSRVWANQTSIAAVAGIFASLSALAIATLRARHERRMQTELSALTRRMTVEKLAASLVHELSQPLAAATHFADAAISFNEDQRHDSLSAALEGVLQQVTLASERLRRAREFALKRPSKTEIVDLGQVIRESEILMREHANDHGVELLCEKPKTKAEVRGDRIQFQQVLVNLIMNSIESCSDSGRDGKVVVKFVEDSAKYEIHVTDNGHGIAPEHRKMIFDAFFTTRADGMGLGLSLCRDIVETYGGTIINENVEQGASFQIELPKASQHEER